MFICVTTGLDQAPQNRTEAGLTTVAAGTFTQTVASFPLCPPAEASVLSRGTGTEKGFGT